MRRPWLDRWTDNGAVELGIQFQTAAAGTVTGIRFYKNPWNTGTHYRESVECHRHLAWFCHLHE